MPPKLRTRKPTGAPSWPLILVAGEAKTGKTYLAALLTGDKRVGRCFWLDLGEGCADEYGAVPGANYEIIEHDGTWIQIIEQVEAVRDIARATLTKGEPPVVLVIDSMTAEWAMLSAWTDARARRSTNNRKMLATDPDAEIDITSNYWNDANSRHNRLMNMLKTFPGIVVMTALESEKTQFGPDGRPVKGAPKVARPDAQKKLSADATVWIRLSLEHDPVIMGIRSIRHNIRPGKDRPKPWPDFTLGALIFEFLEIGHKEHATQVRDMPTLNADQVMPDEVTAELTREEESSPRESIRELIDKYEKVGDLSKLGELWHRVRGDKTKPPTNPDLLDQIKQAGERVKASGSPTAGTALKVVVEELLNAHNVEAAISLMEQVTARPDVEAEVADLLPESDKETLGIREGQSVHLLDLAEKVSHYTEKHKVGPRVVDPVAA